MRIIYNVNMDNVEIQASEKEGEYFISINDKLSFGYSDGKLYQEYVPAKTMKEITDEAKKKEADGVSREEIGQRLKDQQEIGKQKFFYTVLDKDGKLLNEKIEEIIKEFNPTYDL